MRAGTASVSPDGKYLFFTAGRPGDIYWVDAGIFKDLNPNQAEPESRRQGKDEE